MRRSRLTILTFIAAAFARLTIARPADACGGTFCDSGPRSMPVDQKGENILFVMEPGKVEAHIQIQYKGDAHHFSWVLPVQALPEIEVGSEALFTRLLGVTVPSYGYTTQRDSCGFSTGSTGGSGGAGGAGQFVVADASVASEGGVNVVLQETVGAFDVTVLAGGTTQEILDWLTANQYQTPPNAPALFEGYVANKYLFVAVKLTGGAGTDQIHPLVVRYNGMQPCVPLKLTAVAAVEDMGVRTFFLGNKRVVPKGWKHVVPNPVKLDWMSLGANYTDWIGRSVDSPLANGKAFVTEYAGPTAIVGANLIASPKWDASAFSAAAAVDVVALLSQQGLVSCFAPSHSCSYFHPLVLPLLREHVPPPATLTLSSEAGASATITDPAQIEGYFYSCLSCYRNQIDMSAWNPAAFTSALAARIIDPAKHADTLLQTWPYLTRMFTTISPAEMTEDPEFWEHDGLPNVPSDKSQRSGVRRITCSGSSGMTLPDGRTVALTPQSTWPGFAADMPWAERIEEFTASGDPIVLANNTETINGVLKSWNDSQQWPPPGSSSSSTVTTGGTGPDAGGPSSGTGSGPSTTGAPTTGSTGAGGGTSGGGGSGGAGGAGGLGANPIDGAAGAPSTGCGCRTRGASSSAWSAGLGLIAAFAARRRKRVHR